MTTKLFAASTAAYVTFLFSPLIGQLIGLNFKDPISLSIFMLLPTSLTAAAALLITERKTASAFFSPLIGGFTTLATAYLVSFLWKDFFEKLVEIYFSPQYFLAICGSAVVAAAVSVFMKAEKIPELKRAETWGKTEAMTCPYCGREIPVDSIFCPLCGGRIGEKEER